MMLHTEQNSSSSNPMIMRYVAKTFYVQPLNVFKSSTLNASSNISILTVSTDIPERFVFIRIRIAFLILSKSLVYSEQKSNSGEVRHGRLRFSNPFGSPDRCN